MTIYFTFGVTRTNIFDIYFSPLANGELFSSAVIFLFFALRHPQSAFAWHGNKVLKHSKQECSQYTTGHSRSPYAAWGGLGKFFWFLWRI